MIQLIDVPTERTTAATDLILALQTGLYTFFMYSDARFHTFRGYLWMGVFAGICTTSVLGTVAHGFMMKKRTNTILWQILTATFSICYVLIISVFVHDLTGPQGGMLALWVTGSLGFALTVYCLKYPAFVPKIIYLGVGLGVLILGVVLWLVLVDKVPGYRAILGAMAASIAATAVEARQKFRLTLRWKFDHHSAYHALQFIANALFFAGARGYFSAPSIL